SWTRKRSPAVHDCPAQRKDATRLASAAASTSASSRTTIGPLPPSSRSSGFPAARAATALPVAVEPMNPIAWVPGLPAISSPTTAPGPVIIENTPAGNSASTTHSASLVEHTDVELAGAQTTQLPDASAGAISSAAIVYGQFQGVITPTTPRGTRYARTRFDGSCEGGSEPSRRVASPAACRQYSTSSSTSPYASVCRGFPWSSVSASASSSR